MSPTDDPAPIDQAAIDKTASDGAAQLILAARRSRSTFDTLDPFAPQTEAQGYAIDDRVAELLGEPVLGWKIGCTSELAQQILKTDGPMCGRVYQVHDSDVTLSHDDYPSAHLEGEMAFTLSEDLTPRPEPWTPDEVAAAVASLSPCIEVVGGRSTNFLGTPITTVIADAGANGCLVLGTPVTNWRDLDLASVAGSMRVGAEQTGAGTGADVLGSPLNALTWLANHLSARGIGLKAGAVVSTGTCTGVVAAPPGSSALADFVTVGQVAVHFQ